MTKSEHTPETEAAPRRAPWTTPDLIEAEIGSETQKLSSTVEIYVPTLDRHLGPS